MKRLPNRNKDYRSETKVYPWAQERAWYMNKK